MKAKNIKRGGYTPELASQIVDSSKLVNSLSVDLDPQVKFVDGKPTDEFTAYKAYFDQDGLSEPFAVKFEEPVKLPSYLSVVTFINLQACEVGYNIYFKADGIKEAK